MAGSEVHQQPLTIIIPAHNEATVIESSLRSLSPSSSAGHAPFRILVVCNGCTDDTADRARSISGVAVLETGIPSKVGAINLGLEQAESGVVVVMDADIRLAGAHVAGLVRALERPGVLAAAPRVRMEYLPDTNLLVRAFYRLWLSLPYVAEGMVGCGVYALNAQGRRRVGMLPEVIADDGFVRACFSAAERVRVDETIAVVRAPRTWRDLIRIKTRSRLGGYQLADLDDSRLQKTATLQRRWFAWSGIVSSFSLWPCVPVYLLVNLIARVRARKQLHAMRRRGAALVWERDESARAEPRGRLE